MEALRRQDIGVFDVLWVDACGPDTVHFVPSQLKSSYFIRKLKDKMRDERAFVIANNFEENQAKWEKILNQYKSIFKHTVKVIHIDVECRVLIVDFQLKAAGIGNQFLVASDSPISCEEIQRISTEMSQQKYVANGKIDCQQWLGKQTGDTSASN